MSERIAVVGGGIAGLTAAYLLRERYDVTLLEQSGRLGGNAYTLETRDGHVVDIAVAAFGRAGYRNFYRLLDRLGVRTRLSWGSFVSLHDLDTGTGLYVTPGLRALWAQRFRLLRPSTLRALTGLRRGLAALRRRLDAGDLDGESLAEAMARVPPLATGDSRRLLLCTLCLLSSMTADEVLRAPATFFVGKLKTHHDVLSPRAFYSVRCVRGGTRQYVRALAAALDGRIETDARVVSVERGDGVRLVLAGGERRAFDHVVLACNADRALALLAAPTDAERAVLSAFRYHDGRVVVHADHAAFPPRRLIQAYTFLYTEREGRLQTSVNGALWREPGVERTCQLLSSQYPNFPIRPELVELETTLRTPIFDAAACRAARDLPALNGLQHTFHCGSHFGYGLHEDAVTSAQAVAEALGVPPW
jgi:hypothetical protein